MNYLFVCNGNKNRSPYAAEWAAKYCDEMGLRHAFRSAGIYVAPRLARLYRRTMLTYSMIENVDLIFAMDVTVAREINEFRHSKPVIVLNVPDRFSPWNKEGRIPTDMTYDEAVKYAGSSRFGPKVFEKILENDVVPHLFEDHRKTA